MKTFYAEQGVLLFQPFAKDDAKTVGQVLAEADSKPLASSAGRLATSVDRSGQIKHGPQVTCPSQMMS